MTDWSSLEHAYGPASEVPELLAAVAVGEEPAADEAVSALFTLLYHQGSTYSATEAALPALVDLALAGPAAHRASIVGFLGALAREDHTHPLVGEHSGRLEALLDDPAAQVREPAAFLLAEYAGAGRAGRLAERYRAETDPVVRASLLMAVDDTELAAEALRGPDPAAQVCIAAALVLALAEEELPEGAAAVVAAAYQDGDPLDSVWSWDGDTAGRLLEQVAEPALFAVLAAGRATDVRLATAYALADALADPDQAADLVPLLGPLLTDPDRSVRLAAVHAAQRAGRAAGLVADSLAAAAGPLAHGDAPELDNARLALEVLIGIDDPRWRPLLLAAWAHGSTHDRTADVVAKTVPASDPELAAAARARIAAIDADPAVKRVRYNRAAGTSTERAALDRLLTSWPAGQDG